MKKSFHVFFLFVLFAFFAVNAAWAAALCPSSLQEDSDGCYVNMPATGTSTVNITADDITNGLTSFKVYDDGGKDGDFSSYADGLLLLTVPEGYKLAVLGSIDLMQDYHYAGCFSVKDGSSIEDPSIMEYCQAMDIGINLSSGNALLFNLKGDDAGSRAPGLDLTVKVMKDGAIDLADDGEGGFFVNMPLIGFNSIDLTDYIANGVTSFKVYDDGGKDGDFSPYADGELLLMVPDGYKLVVSGTIAMKPGELSSAGRFMIYDGSSNVDGYMLSSDVKDVGVRMSSGNALLLCLIANEKNYGASGLDLTVKVMKDETMVSELADDGNGGLYVNMPSVGTNSVDLTKYIADGVTSFKVYDDGGKDGDYCYNAEGFLLLTVPEGYRLKVSGTMNTYSSGRLSIYDGISMEAKTLLSAANGADKDIGSFISTDRALFFKFWTTTGNEDEHKSGLDLTVNILKMAVDLADDGEGNLYVNMPVISTNTLNLTEYVANGVTSFKVYDDGGKDGNFTSFVNGYLEMTAPAGYQFMIQGSMNTFCSSGPCAPGEFVVYDGNAGATKVLQEYGNVSNINAHSSGNTMTLYFRYGAAGLDYNTDSGLDFTVTVVAQHSVNIAGATGGKVTTNKETADEGTTVTLTTTPNEGYILNSISVVGLDGKLVEVNNGIWHIGGNTIIFTMPEEAVFVTPLFVPVGDVFVNMPKTGNMEVVIHEGMESIKVYDDGGKDGNYSDQSDAILQLIAPENYVFQISGSVTTEYFRDFLKIYDGNEVADNSLLLNTINNESVDLNGANILTSLNNVITIKFYSDRSINKSGFDLKVTLVKPTFGAVSIAKADDGKIHATINGDYAENETLSIPEAIEVDAVDYNRELEAGIPVTAMLPVTLPAGTTVNADFYTLKEVVQDGDKWHATMKYIGDGNLPQPNTPYAVILHEGESELKFNLNGEKATVQTGNVQEACGFNAPCKRDENGQITDDWFFTGTYAYKEWKDGDEEIGLAYAFAATNNPGGAAKGKFGKIIAGAYGSAMRCYLRKRDANVKLQKASQVAAASYVARYSVNYVPETDFVDVEFVSDGANGEKTTAIGRMNMRTGEFEMLRNFDLKGRKVNSTNRARGAYYGKKVLKK